MKLAKLLRIIHCYLGLIAFLLTLISVPIFFLEAHMPLPSIDALNMLSLSLINLLVGSLFSLPLSQRLWWLQLLGSILLLISLLASMITALTDSSLFQSLHIIWLMLFGVVFSACAHWHNFRLHANIVWNTAARETGTVKWFNVSKGFGFISRARGDDVFVHFKAIRGQGHRTLTEGQQVEFLVTARDKGLQAEDVVSTPPDMFHLEYDEDTPPPPQSNND